MVRLVLVFGLMIGLAITIGCNGGSTGGGGAASKAPEPQKPTKVSDPKNVLK